MTSTQRRCLAALVLSLVCINAAASGKCVLVGAEEMNQAFPEGAPWITIDGEKAVGNKRCQFTADPRPSGNNFVDTKSIVVIEKISMGSDAEAEIFLSKRMEAYRKDSSNEVHTGLFDGSGFRVLHKSKSDQASKDAMWVFRRQQNVVFEESFVLQHPIGQRDQDAAVALMVKILQASH